MNDTVQNKGRVTPALFKGFGHQPSQTLIVFDHKPKTLKEKEAIEEFIRRLRYEIGQDYWATYAVKYNKKLYSKKDIKKFSAILKKEFLETNPHLVILMGKVSAKLMLGSIASHLSENIFYTKFVGDNLRQYFIGSNMSKPKSVGASLDKLILFIKEHYV
jgi:hypothetical protein